MSKKVNGHVYRSMQGKEIDMNKLAMQNETTLAVSNVRINARGDELGPGGKIIKKREEVLRGSQSPIPNENVIRKQETPLVPVQKSIPDTKTIRKTTTSEEDTK